ncbi:MAG TPA: hemerythrin domain-containing protein [Candidatus Acidoferrales bacterium]|nr:hemerythrin domain-containing protein [Candidatus Acidoferrales bacterium]
MDSDLRPSHPIAILKWEHKKLEERFDKLPSIVARSLNGNTREFCDKLNLALKLLEAHQEAEERFLFPLIPRMEDFILSNLKKEHLSMLDRADIIVSSNSIDDWANLHRVILSLSTDLKSHFFSEEATVFAEAEKNLTVAQTDILKIKFATRGFIL